MNQRSETSSSLFLDTAHGETVCSTVVVRRKHAATVEVQAVTAILAARRGTPIAAAAAHVAHATVDAVAITSSREPIAVIGTTRCAGYADQLKGDDRVVLKLRPGITGPATLKYRLEDEMISDYVAKRQLEGDHRAAQDIAVEYNDQVIYPDKVRINRYYYEHYSFCKDIQMIFCTVFGKKMRYAGETI